MTTEIIFIGIGVFVFGIFGMVCLYKYIDAWAKIADKHDLPIFFPKSYMFRVFYKGIIDADENDAYQIRRLRFWGILPNIFIIFSSLSSTYNLLIMFIVFSLICFLVCSPLENKMAKK